MNYWTGPSGKTFKEVANKNVELPKNVGTFQLHRLILVEAGNNITDTLNNSIYAKMFLNKDGWFVSDIYYLYVEQTLTPKKQIGDFTIQGEHLSNLINSTSLYEKKNVKQYNMETVNQADIQNYFKVGKPKRYWTNTNICISQLKSEPFRN